MYVCMYVYMYVCMYVCTYTLDQTILGRWYAASGRIDDAIS